MSAASPAEPVRLIEDEARAVVRKSRITVADGKRYSPNEYNLNAV
jgi:hypothetical protein